MSGKQMGFSDYEQSTANKQTKRGKSLHKMDVVVPWQARIDLIEPPLPQSQQEERSASVSIDHNAENPLTSAVDITQ